MKIQEIDKSTAIGRILEAKSATSYFKSEIEPTLPEMEEWERKEYKAAYVFNLQEVQLLLDHIRRNEAVFNEVLQKYNLSATVFLAKYIYAD